MKMGKVLAKRKWTSQGRVSGEEGKSSNSTREVLKNDTLDWAESARTDSWIFGETLLWFR